MHVSSSEKQVNSRAPLSGVRLVRAVISDGVGNERWLASWGSPFHVTIWTKQIMIRILDNYKPRPEERGETEGRKRRKREKGARLKLFSNPAPFFTRGVAVRGL
jgi:hypothetical protein